MFVQQHLKVFKGHSLLKIFKAKWKLKMASLKLVVSKIYQDPKAWKYQRLSGNPYSKEFCGILIKRRAGKGHRRTLFQLKF